MTVDELERYGMEQMDDEEIQQLLTTQDYGILALPTDGAPSMRPLSFWFDGDDTVYFLYVSGDSSEKEALSRRAEIARFLVYRIETTFNWRSVLLTGKIDPVPESERPAIEEQADIPWRPDVFRRAMESETTSLYRFRIDEQSGIKQLELPPELRTEDSRSKPR
jgi:nitroimidazol reductase NimA-like FMN-containing flavoprotein (pyridoxamine 5'-phosphate oxidase superfamily)